MSFHSHLWSQAAHGLGTYVTDKGFQHARPWWGAWHTEGQPLNAGRNPWPGATYLHIAWKDKPEGAAASLENSNCSLLLVTQKYLHEDYLSKFSVAEAPLKTNLTQNREVFMRFHFPLCPSLWEKKMTSIWFVPNEELEECQWTIWWANSWRCHCQRHVEYNDKPLISKEKVRLISGN